VPYLAQRYYLISEDYSDLALIDRVMMEGSGCFPNLNKRKSSQVFTLLEPYLKKRLCGNERKLFGNFGKRCFLGADLEGIELGVYGS